MSDSHDEIRTLEAELSAAREIIATLKQRIEADAQVQELDRFAVRKAMANLENTVAQRTRALTASEARYRALFEHGPDMTLMVNERGIVTDVNQTTVSSLGRPMASLVDVPLRSLFQASSAEAAAKLVARGVGTELELVLDDGRTLWESNAILNHLAAGSPLWPEDGFLRAQVMQWQFFEQYSHEPNIAVARFIARYLGLPDDRRAEYESKQVGGHRALSVMETRLGTHAYLVGETLTVADLALYAYTHVADEGGFDLSGYPGICAWLDRVSGTPGYVPMTGS